MAATTSVHLLPAILLPVIAWRVYVRFKCNVGPQPFLPRKLTRRIVFLSLITVLLLAAVGRNPPALEGMLGGMTAGALLAFLGLKLTRFELNADGEFYIPNTAIGVGLTLLLVGRMFYRGLGFLMNPPVAPVPPGTFQSPLTLAVFGLSMGYFIAYNLGLVLRGKRIAREQAESGRQ